MITSRRARHSEGGGRFSRFRPLLFRLLVWLITVTPSNGQSNNNRAAATYRFEQQPEQQVLTHHPAADLLFDHSIVSPHNSVSFRYAVDWPNGHRDNNTNDDQHYEYLTTTAAAAGTRQGDSESSSLNLVLSFDVIAQPSANPDDLRPNGKAEEARTSHNPPSVSGVDPDYDDNDNDYYAGHLSHEEFSFTTAELLSATQNPPHQLARSTSTNFALSALAPQRLLETSSSRRLTADPVQSAAEQPPSATTEAPHGTTSDTTYSLEGTSSSFGWSTSTTNRDDNDYIHSTDSNALFTDAWPSSTADFPSSISLSTSFLSYSTRDRDPFNDVLSYSTSDQDSFDDETATEYYHIVDDAVTSTELSTATATEQDTLVSSTLPAGTMSSSAYDGPRNTVSSTEFTDWTENTDGEESTVSTEFTDWTENTDEEESTVSTEFTDWTENTDGEESTVEFTTAEEDGTTTEDHSDAEYDETTTWFDFSSTNEDELQQSTDFEAEFGTASTQIEETMTWTTEATSSEPPSSSVREEANMWTSSSDAVNSRQLYSTSVSSSSSFGVAAKIDEDDDEATASAYLPWIPQKKISNRMPLEVLVEEIDMTLLGGAIKSNPKYELLKNVGMTIFAPVDSAFEGLPIDMKKLKSPSASLKDKGGLFSGRKSGSDANDEAQVDNGVKTKRSIARESPVFKRQLASKLNRYGNKSQPIDCATQTTMADPFFEECLYVQGAEWQRARSAPPLFEHPAYASYDGPPLRDRMEDFEQLIMFHVVRRQVPPGMIESKKLLSLRTEMKDRMLEVRFSAAIEPELPAVIVNGDARVVEIVACKNGFIYKIDKPLFPPWNIGYPSLVDAVRSNPRYSKLRFLMDQSKMFDRWALAGPITTLLVPDEAWRLDGLAVPSCFFRALARVENRDALSKLLRWVTIPGIWTKDDIQRTEWLPNGIAPSLSVVNVRMLVRKEDEDVDTPSEIHTTTLIEGKEVTQWDIPLYNGYAHIISELPIRPDLDLRDVLWDCLDSFCSECPVVTRLLLKYLDDGGLLPDIHNPRGYVVPPGVRPDWVCSEAEQWFPPGKMMCSKYQILYGFVQGWDYHEWKKYLELAKSGSIKSAQNHAHSGWRKAAIRTAELLDKLDEAEVHLRKIWHIYGDPGSFVIGANEDANRLIGWLKNRRSLEHKPRICEARGPRKPGQLLDRDIWELDLANDDGLTPYNPRTEYLHRLERDRRRQFGMQDLRYVAQWIP